MPAFNPLREDHIQKLREKMQSDRESLRTFQENRQEMIDSYAGSSYGDGGESGHILVNLSELAINIYQRQLASHTPQVMVESPVQNLRPVAEELAIAVNHLITHEIDLGESLNDCVYDALFTMGIMKVGITPKEHGNYEGFTHDSGQPFADPIDFSDWIHDMSAKRWDQIDYCGNRYEMPFDLCMESPLFTKKGKNDLLPMLRTDAGMDFGAGHNEDPSKLSHEAHAGEVEYVKKVILWDIWLPRENLIVTMPANGYGAPLRIVEWEGPERGPYHMLGFSKVPNNLIPLAPSMIWEDLNDLINRLALKAGMQADRQKSVLAAQNRASSTAEAIIATPDGMAITTDVDPNAVREFQFGGVDQNLMASFDTFRNLFSYLAGNLDALGGLAPQTGTLGQDKLLSEGATQRVNDMRDRVVKFTTGIVEDLAFYLWNDPSVDLPLTKKITPTIERNFRWSEENKLGEFFDYNFRIVPHSLQARSPQEKLNTLLMLVNQTVLPMMPMLQEQGIRFDVEQFLKIVAKLSNSPELEKILVRDSGLTLGAREPVETRKPNTSERHYVRHDRGTGKPQQSQPPQFESRPEPVQPQPGA